MDSAKQDADVLIVQTTIASAQSKYQIPDSREADTILVGDDTDLLVLLLHHADVDSNDIFLSPENTKASKTKKVWCIKQCKALLGSKLCEYLLFMPAILGCDTVAHLFGLCKGIVVKKVSDSHFYKCAETCTKKDVSKEYVIFAGDKALVLLYGDSYAEGLDSLRYKRFCNKVSKSTSPVHPQSLPPTSAAAKYHSLHVYYQVMVFKDFSHDLKPEDWG